MTKTRLASERPGQSRAPARPVATEPQTTRQEFHAAHSHATPNTAPAAVHPTIASIPTKKLLIYMCSVCSGITQPKLNPPSPRKQSPAR